MEHSRQFDSYRMSHQPDLGEEAVGAHEAHKLYPDLHENPRLYTTGEGAPDRETMTALRRAKDKPDATVTIHRSTPSGQINPGDWVSLSKTYAKQHGFHATDPKQDVPVVSMKVPAREVREGSGNSIHEWGWHPQ